MRVYQLIAQGIHLSVIKDILGHAQISTTADVYGHVFLETQRQATTELDTLFGTPEGHIRPTNHAHNPGMLPESNLSKE